MLDARGGNGSYSVARHPRANSGRDRTDLPPEPVQVGKTRRRRNLAPDGEPARVLPKRELSRRHFGRSHNGPTPPQLIPAPRVRRDFLGVPERPERTAPIAKGARPQGPTQAPGAVVPQRQRTSSQGRRLSLAEIGALPLSEAIRLGLRSAPVEQPAKRSRRK